MITPSIHPASKDVDNFYTETPAPFPGELEEDAVGPDSQDSDNLFRSILNGKATQIREFPQAERRVGTGRYYPGRHSPRERCRADLPGVPQKASPLLSTHYIPYDRLTIRPGRNDPSTVGTELGREDDVGMPDKPMHEFPRFGIPDDSRAVKACRYDPSPVRTELRRPDPVGVPAQGMNLLTGHGIPDTGCPVEPRRNDARSVGREAGLIEWTEMPRQADDAVAGKGIPHDRAPVM